MGDESKLLEPLAGAEEEVRRRAFWRICGGLLDAFTVTVSVADIITDVLVLMEFRRLGHAAFFQLSAAVFALAQLSYAFLFAATFAGHRSAKFRSATFLAVLPLAQLVPLFAWLEALRLPAVDRRLEALGLQPTAGPQASGAADVGDSLWSFLQAKYQSHAGFLVEAFVEAVPQAVLQTVFAATVRQGTALNAASVGISVFTVASKGYLVSYALDYATFFFNFGCIIADCLGLFAIVTTIALRGLDGILAPTLAAISLSGLVLSVVAGHSALWFSILDDHLKLRDPKKWPSGVRGVSSVFFDLYVVRLAAWFLAIVPCVVLFMGARLSLLPVCVLRSVDPDLVRHARFFRSLASFLDGQGGGSRDRRARLWTVNTFVARARRSAGQLERALQACSREHQGAALRRWVADVGNPRILGIRPWQHAERAQGPAAGDEDDDAALQQAILESLRPAASRSSLLGMTTLAFRRLRVVMWLRSQVRTVWRELQHRSEIFRGRGSASGQSHQRGLSDWALRAGAFAAVAVAALCALPLAAGHAALVVVSVIFPALHVVPNCWLTAAGARQLELVAGSSPAPQASSAVCLAESSAAQALPCGLAAAYCVVLLCMLALAPVVARRQLLWLDLVDLHRFPDAFYGGAVLVELRKRHLRDSMLRDRLGHFLTQYLLRFLED